MKASDLPRNIRWFERIAYFGLVLPLALTPFNPTTYTSFQKFGALPFVVGALMYVLFARVIWCISRKRKNWLRWTWAALFAIGLLSIPQLWDERMDFPVNFISQAFWMLIQGVSTYLLFAGDAVPWFRQDRVVDPDTFA